MSIPVAVWSGTFTIFGVALRCHVLDDGQRIVEADSLDNLFAAMAGDALPTDGLQDELAAFVKWQRGVGEREA